MKNNTFILVTWNSENQIGSTLSSIMQYEHESDIIIVDNDSQDGTVELVTKDFPSVRIYVNEQNEGFAKANNRALSFVETEFVTIINPDTHLVQPIVKKLEKHFLDEHAGLIGCKLINDDGSLQPSMYKFQSPSSIFIEQFRIGKFMPEFLKRRLSPEFTKHDREQRVDWLIGAFLITKTNMLKNVGGFSEDYFMYSEDMDLGYKYHIRDLSVIFDPSCIVQHTGGTSEKQDESSTKSQKLITSFMVFARKYDLDGNIIALIRSYKLKKFVVTLIIKVKSTSKLKGTYKRYVSNIELLEESSD